MLSVKICQDDCNYVSLKFNTHLRPNILPIRMDICVNQHSVKWITARKYKIVPAISFTSSMSVLSDLICIQCNVQPVLFKLLIATYKENQFYEFYLAVSDTFCSQ